MTQPVKLPKLHALDEAAELLNVSKDTVRREIAQKARLHLDWLFQTQLRN